MSGTRQRDKGLHPLSILQNSHGNFFIISLRRTAGYIGEFGGIRPLVSKPALVSGQENTISSGRRYRARLFSSWEALMKEATRLPDAKFSTFLLLAKLYGC